MPLISQRIMPSSRMHLLFRFFFVVVAFAFAARSAQADNFIGRVEVEGSNAIAVHISGSTPELDSLANVAFNTHGRYRRVATGGAFDLRFSAVGTNQVKVDVLKAGKPVLSQTVGGTSTRNALLRAADVAVKATSGLKGFFASRLAFIGERTGKPEIYTSDLFFGEVRQITKDNAQAMTPRWAPDGSKIVYTSFFKSGFPDIFLIDLASLQRTTFVSFKGTNSGARFSPDGRQAAMVLSGEGNPEIYVSNAQGRQVTRRTRTSAVEASPCWSPDGSRLVFTSDSAGGPQLYTMAASGGAPSRVPTSISGYCAEPDWSVGDPSKIAFTMRIGRGYQIGMYDFKKGGSAVQVSNAPMDAVSPAWLADGRHIVFTARAANTRSLWILDTETRKATKISPDQLGRCEQASVWGP